MKRKDFLKAIAIGAIATPFISFQSLPKKTAVGIKKADTKRKYIAIRQYFHRSPSEDVHIIDWRDEDRTSKGLLRNCILDENENVWLISAVSAYDQTIELELRPFKQGQKFSFGTLVIYQNEYPENGVS